MAQMAQKNSEIAEIAREASLWDAKFAILVIFRNTFNFHLLTFNYLFRPFPESKAGGQRHTRYLVPANRLPAAHSQFLSFGQRAHRNPHHRLAQPAADLDQNVRVVEMGGGFHNGLRPLGRVAALENA
jgi:hypothetical protein